MTIAEWVRSAETRLASITPSPRLEAQLLAAHALGISRTGVLTHPGEEFPDLAGESLLARRMEEEPLAYILGRREFFGREFVVRRGVLVPRQDTETLVEVVLALDLSLDARAVEVGVGSGCVVVTLALERPGWTVVGTEISSVAREIARENAERLGARIDLREGDLLAPVAGEQFDLVVSNPPYIDPSETLAHEVRGWEPPEALFAGESGLLFYRRLAEEAPVVLRSGGRLAVEVGHTQASSVAALLWTHGWTEVEITLDLAGIPRVVAARRGG